jgi:hypothetical protein
MKNAPQADINREGSVLRSSQNNDNSSTSYLSDQRALAQAVSRRSNGNIHAVDIAHVGAIWKSLRDRQTCIQAALKSYNGAPYLDLRIFEMDDRGRMCATRKGITVSPQKMMQLAMLVGDAARKAHALGLVTGTSS